MTTQQVPGRVHRSRPGPTPPRRPASRGPVGRGRLGTGLAGLQERWGRLVGADEAELAPHRHPGPAYALFALALALYPVHQLLTRGRWIADGAMWAEMATNYFVKANSPFLTERLFGPDAGYIPLPQRLIAMVGADLGISPSAMPYFYTGSAIVGAALLISPLCLPVFRPVIASDGLRFALALALMLLPDFESRTFINFTYFAVVPAVALTALAAVGREVPRWAWFLPLFILSKPGVLAVLPAMVVVAVLSPGRFRRIAAVSAVLGVVQIVRLAISGSTGPSLLQESDQSAVSKLFTAGKYTVGIIGRLLAGPDAVLGVYPWMFFGIALILLLGAGVFALRSRAAPLVPIGLSLAAFTMLVNCFSFSAAFSRDMALLSVPTFDRRFVVALIGVLFVAAALLAMVLESPRVARPWGRFDRAQVVRAASIAATALFALWFVASGWLRYAEAVNQPFGVPTGDVSQWQEMSTVIVNTGEPVVCVPIEPFSWVYGRECANLLPTQGVPFTFAWTPAEDLGQSEDAGAAADRDADTGTDPGAEDSGTGTGTGVGNDGDAVISAAGYEVEPSVPDEVQDGKLASLGVLVRTEPGVHGVRARAIVTSRDGTETVLTGATDVPPNGGLVQFLGRPTPLVEDVESLRIVFDQPVEVATSVAEDPDAAIVLWMGQPA